MKSVLLLAALVASAHAQSAAPAKTIVLSGAGTTNPQNYFRTVMEYLTMESKLPVKAVYRAVGSSTGYKEFIGTVIKNGVNMDGDGKAISANATLTPKNDFGAGDIPIAKSYYDAAMANNPSRKIMQIPLFLGAIAIFYNNGNGAVGQIKLDGCLLARIFSGQITTWQDADIAAFQDAGVTLPQGDITVVHRVHGSSSTSGTTSYLNTVSNNMQCSNPWPATLNGGKAVGSTVGTGGKWFPGNRDMPAQGSSGVLNAIKNTPGAIGYLDAGHGRSQAGLSEVSILNAAGAYVKSSDLATSKGLENVAEYAVAKKVFNEVYTSDWSAVQLLNLGKADAAFTWDEAKRKTFWPITMVTYMYINPEQQNSDPTWFGLWKFFINYIATSDEGQSLASHPEFGFIKLPPAVIAKNKEQIAQLVKGPANAPVWIQETASSTLALKGAGDYVISGKRKSNSFARREQLSESIGQAFDLKGNPTSSGLAQELVKLDTAVKELQTKNAAIDQLKTDLMTLTATVQKLRQDLDNSKNTPKTVSGYQGVHARTFDFETTMALLLTIGAMWTALVKN